MPRLSVIPGTRVVRAVPTNTITGGVSIAVTANFICSGSMRLPMYSGVRPTISPAAKTPITAKTIMPMKPTPTPPNTTSSLCISHIGKSPAAGENESCMAFTAPPDAAVMAIANNATDASPKRTSLPSGFMRPGPYPKSKSACGVSLSNHANPTIAAAKITHMAPHTVQP